MSPESRLTAADDSLHPVRAGDPTWAETAWFAAQIPERELGIWFYSLFRPNLGTMAVAIYVWGPDGRELWQQPYYRLYWHLPIPENFDLRNFDLPEGLSYRAKEPLKSYEIRYTDGDAFKADLGFDAVHDAHELGITDEFGHIDQLGKVRGEIELHGERIEVDCIEMRDRTWSPRREKRDRTSLSYSYGAVSETEAFHFATKLHPEKGRIVLGGFTIRDGAMTNLGEGSRRVERDRDGRPDRIFVQGKDEAGNEVEAVGKVVSQMAMHTSPYFVWVSQVRWELPGGRIAWGEDQDTWSPGMLRSLRADPEVTSF